MATSKTLLGAVHHISEHSIFFLPSHSDNLDLKTLSTAPPCHRAVLQRNGLVAKICAGITFPEDKDVSANVVRRDSRHHAEEAPVKREALTVLGRREAWRSALTYAGLLSSKDAVLHIPDQLQTTPWPYLTPTQYCDYVKQAVARTSNATINSSKFCVPVLSLQEYVYKRPDVELSLAVMWMPYYTQNLRQWAATFEASGKPIPEAWLLAMLHHVTSAQLTMRSVDTIAGRSETATAVASSPTVDLILVYQSRSETGDRTSDWNDEPTFVLAASITDGRSSIALQNSSEDRDTSLTSPADMSQQHHLQQLVLYRPPEECHPTLYPTFLAGTAKRAVWGLGIILYLLASGRANLHTPQGGVVVPDNQCLHRPAPRSPRRARVVEEVPFNAFDMTPDALWRRLRRDLERRGYGGTLTTLAAQLLSLDPFTRPSLTTVDRMLQDLHRPTPIHRFPFAIGGYDLLRLPNPSDAVELNPGARRYTFAEVCVLCKQPRSSTAVCTKGGDHQTAGVTSPSWSDDGELLPAVCPASDCTYMAYLYPLYGAANGRQRRRQAAHALQNANASMSVMRSSNTSSGNYTTPDILPMHCGFLLQVFGGFAIYERLPEYNAKGQLVYKARVREVLIPYPSQGLRRSEMALVKTTLEFGGGLPWPSCCTETLQRSGRVSRHVPFALTGAHHDVEWFGWVLPGERFAMPNGAHWAAPPDGAFVFWFGPDLQPTDRDRFFALTNVRSATLPTKVPRTNLPDAIFWQHLGEESQAGKLLLRSVASNSSRCELQAGHSGVRSSVTRRRSTMSVADIMLPSATHEIVEDDDGEGVCAACIDDAVLHSAQSCPSSRRANGTDGTASSALSTRRRRISATRSRRAPTYQVSNVEARTLVTREAEEDTRNRNDGKRRVLDAAPHVCERAAPNERVVVAPSGVKPITPNLRHRSPLKQPPPLQCEVSEPHPSTTRPTSAAAAVHVDADHHDDRDVVASDAASLRYSAPAAYNRISSRESTQPPSHRDTSEKNVRKLSSLPVNETLNISRNSATEEKKRKTRATLPTADAPQPSTPHRKTEARNTGFSPLPQETGHPLSTRSLAPSALPPLLLSTSPPRVENLTQKLSPGPSKRPSSLFSSASCSARQPQRGLMTPNYATPKLAPASQTVSVLSTLRICGLWLPADAVNAVFQALTFWVFSTGEHGYMCTPIEMSNPMRYAIRAPPGAAYLSFLSNQVPLFRRNHPRMDVAIVSPQLQHHGFACYNADGELLGVLALRCSLKEDTSVLCGEFVLDTHVKGLHPNNNNSTKVASGALYASYLSGSVGDEKAVLRAKAAEAEPMSPLRHSPSVTLVGGDSRVPWKTPSEAQTLTLTSARHLDEEFTPDEEDGFALDKAPTPVLPACWMGFDSGSGSLLFSDVEQAIWVSYGIGD